jgi:hypothetical protein
MQAAQAGVEILRRVDASPLAVLGVAIVTTAAPAVQQVA